MIGNISIKIFDSLPTTNLLLISDSDYESNQSETEENHQYSIVTKETFTELQRFSGEWKYTDNSYYMDDNNESYTETKKISCGFFQYMNSNWYNKTGSFMKSLIIKCRYEELKDGNIAVLFTPFVVVKSIRYENAVNICRKLYADTEIGKWLENTTERISYVLLLNLIECFTNLYTWILFESKLKVYFNTSEIKLDLLQSNLNPASLDTIKMMFTWKQINFESQIEQVNKIGNIATWTQEKNNNVSLNTIEEVYELLYQQVIEINANLAYADLRNADLKEANLRKVNLNNVNLREANLYGANLSYADLNNSALNNADLREANLYRAFCYYTNLCGADLRNADLSYADMYGANLRDTNLFGVNLKNANIIYVEISEDTKIDYPIACPETGSFIGYKKAVCEYIVKLQICKDAKRSSATTKKCRCSKALVLAIENIYGSDSVLQEIESIYNPSFVYRVGKIVEVPDFDDNRWNECAPGIHFFIDRQDAVEYEF